jgi:hypothetical protein
LYILYIVFRGRFGWNEALNFKHDGQMKSVREIIGRNFMGGEFQVIARQCDARKLWCGIARLPPL